VLLTVEQLAGGADPGVAISAPVCTSGSQARRSRELRRYRLPRGAWPADEPDPAATVSWRTGTGRYRNVGARRLDGVEHVELSLEDAYLLLRGGSAPDEPAQEAAS